MKQTDSRRVAALATSLAVAAAFAACGNTKPHADVPPAIAKKSASKGRGRSCNWYGATGVGPEPQTRERAAREIAKKCGLSVREIEITLAASKPDQRRTVVTGEPAGKYRNKTFREVIATLRRAGGSVTITLPSRASPALAHGRPRTATLPEVRRLEREHRIIEAP